MGGQAQVQLLEPSHQGQQVQQCTQVVQTQWTLLP